MSEDNLEKPSFDKESYFESLRSTGKGHIGPDGKLLDEYVDEEIKNKLTTISTYRMLNKIDENDTRHAIEIIKETPHKNGDLGERVVQLIKGNERLQKFFGSIVEE